MIAPVASYYMEAISARIAWSRQTRQHEHTQTVLIHTLQRAHKARVTQVSPRRVTTESGRSHAALPTDDGDTGGPSNEAACNGATPSPHGDATGTPQARMASDRRCSTHLHRVSTRVQCRWHRHHGGGVIAEGDGIAMVTTPGSAPWLNSLAQLLGSASWLSFLAQPQTQLP